MCCSTSFGVFYYSSKASNPCEEKQTKKPAVKPNLIFPTYSLVRLLESVHFKSVIKEQVTVNVTWGFISKLERLNTKKQYDTTGIFQLCRFQNYLKIGSILHKVSFQKHKIL